MYIYVKKNVFGQPGNTVILIAIARLFVALHVTLSDGVIMLISNSFLPKE